MNHAIETVDDLIAELRNHDPTQPVRLIVDRQGAQITQVVAADEDDRYEAGGVYIEAGHDVEPLPRPIYWRLS
jgi:hypothetical protein